MNWLSSLKEKSTQIVQLYKTELSDFVSNLNEDVTSIMKKEEEEEGAEKANTEEGIELNNSEATKEQEKQQRYAILREVLEIFLGKRASDPAELEHKFNLILATPEKYLKRDPLNLVMMERKDFTNFLVFYNQNKNKEELVTKILTFEPTLPQVLVTDEYKGGEKKDSVNRFILRFIYSMIYLLETDVSSPLKPRGSAIPEKKAEVKTEAIKEESEKLLEEEEKPVEKAAEEGKEAADKSENKENEPVVQQEGAQKEEELYKI